MAAGGREALKFLSPPSEPGRPRQSGFLPPQSILAANELSLHFRWYNSWLPNQMISLWYLELSIIYISIPRWLRNIAQQSARGGSPYCFFGTVFFQTACRIVLGPPKHVLHLVWSVFVVIYTAIRTALKEARGARILGKRRPVSKNKK